MRDKGTNEVRALLTDLAISVIRQVVANDPDRSQNSIIRDVMDAWAKKKVMRDLRKRDALNLRIRDYESYGVDTASLRQETAKQPKSAGVFRKMPDFSGQCRKVPKYAVSMPWTTAPRGIENETGPLRSPDKSRNKGWKNDRRRKIESRSSI